MSNRDRVSIRPCKFCGEHVEDIDDPEPDFGDPVWVHWGCLP